MRRGYRGSQSAVSKLGLTGRIPISRGGHGVRVLLSIMSAKVVYQTQNGIDNCKLGNNPMVATWSRRSQPVYALNNVRLSAMIGAATRASSWEKTQYQGLARCYRC